MRQRLWLILLLPFTIGVAIYETIAYYHVWEVRHAPMVEGDIIRRELIESMNGFRKMGRLTIRIVETQTFVTADTNSTDLKELPDRVTFHYSGDPAREVFVEGEEDPFWVAVVTFLVSAGIIWFCAIPYLPKATKQPDQLIDEWSKED